MTLEEFKNKSNAESGWTYEEVAKALQISRTMVGHYVMGTKYPSLPVMRRVERVYGWPLMEQIGCIPDIGRDNRYAEQLRYWLGAK